MNINKTNIQAIHNVLITDLQRRMFKDYNQRKNEFGVNDEDYDRAQSAVYRDVCNCNSIQDINDLLLNYSDLFDKADDISHLFSLDGTLNYVLDLFIDKLRYFEENNGE